MQYSWFVGYAPVDKPDARRVGRARQPRELADEGPRGRAEADRSCHRRAKIRRAARSAQRQASAFDVSCPSSRSRGASMIEREPRARGRAGAVLRPLASVASPRARPTSRRARTTRASDSCTASKYDEATAKFRDAVARVPEAKYFFNLCTSLFQEGKFGEALTACNSAAQEQPGRHAQGQDRQDIAAGSRTRRRRRASTCSRSAVAAAIRTCRHPIRTPATPATPATRTRPATPSRAAEQPAAPIRNAGKPAAAAAAVVGQPTVQYRPVQGRRRPSRRVSRRPARSQLHVDARRRRVRRRRSVRLRPTPTATRRRVPHQERLPVQPAHTGSARSATSSTRTSAQRHRRRRRRTINSLDIFDVGVGALQAPVPRAASTAVPDAARRRELALMRPERRPTRPAASSSTTRRSACALELAAAYAFGPRYRTCSSVTRRRQLRTRPRARSRPTARRRVAVGLDQAGGSATLSFGYTYRFNTPLGQSAFITLE